jgi:hypothetical protein
MPRYHKSHPAGIPREVNLPFNWPGGWRTVRASCAGRRTSSVYLVGGDGSARLFGKSGRDRFHRGKLFGAE